MTTLSSYCRACEGMCGVEADVDGGRITALRGDPANPKSAGHLCPVAAASADPEAPRLDRPLKRSGDGYEAISWDQAISEIGEKLRRVRSAQGPRGLALYAGGPLAFDHAAVLRTASFAFAMGTPNLFTELAMYGASKFYATELVLGAALPLQADVGRSHYTVLLGADQGNTRWGPGQAGTIHSQALDYFRKRRKGTKLIAVDSRRTDLAREADEHVRVRPGTEVFYMLGLAHATLENRWIDEQYVRDYTHGFEQARRWLEPWTPARCAEICGIEVGELAGVGLKYGRSAMSVVVPSAGLLQSRHGTVAAWAWLVHAAVTANLLRPGGLYEAGGIVDLHEVLSSLPSEGAPASQVRGFRSLLCQQPGTALAEEILDADKGAKALICLSGCPLSELPGRSRTQQALDALDLLVVVDDQPSATSARADYVLPSTRFWERSDLHLLDNGFLPSRMLQATGPVLPPRGEARDTSDILRDLLLAASPPLRGGEWGQHLKLLGRKVGMGDMDTWIDRILDWTGAPSREQLAMMPSGFDEGETDRGEWRPGYDDQKLQLAPAQLEVALRALSVPDHQDYPLSLVTHTVWPGGWGWRYRSAEVQEPGVGMHPDAGFEAGAIVRIETRSGSAEGPVRHDDSLHPEAVVVPWGWAVPAGDLVGAQDVCPLSGTPEQGGLPCRVVPARK
jgi:anaerobic selenocysteine-containing dehydrogenase